MVKRPNESNLPSQDLFVFIRRTMYVTCMHPMHIEQYFPQGLHFIGALMEVLLEVFSYFVLIHIAILYGCTLYLFYGDGDIEYLSNCLIQSIIYVWALFMTIYFRRLRLSSVEDLMKFINTNYVTRSGKGFTYVTMDGSLAMSLKWSKIFIYCCFIGVLFWSVIPIVYQNKSLPLACWYPFDYKQPYIYETLFLLQTIGQLQIGAAFAASNAFFMILSILISGQYDVLNCNLKNILAKTYICQGGSKEDLKPLSKLSPRLCLEKSCKIPLCSILREHQKISDDELNQYFCSEEKSINDMEVIIPNSKTTFMAISRRQRQTLDELIRLEFKICIEHHRFILEALEKMEKFFHPIWFFKMGQVTFLLCLVAFVSVKSTTANTSFAKIASLIQYLGLIIWDLFLICYFGQIVHVNSQRCGEALLRCPWHLQMILMKSDMLIFILNSQRPFRLTAGKFYNLNMERFRNIITTAFSFLTLLQKMDKR